MSTLADVGELDSAIVTLVSGIATGGTIESSAVYADWRQAW